MGLHILVGVDGHQRAVDSGDGNGSRRLHEFLVRFDDVAITDNKIFRRHGEQRMHILVPITMTHDGVTKQLGVNVNDLLCTRLTQPRRSAERVDGSISQGSRLKRSATTRAKVDLHISHRQNPSRFLREAGLLA